MIKRILFLTATLTLSLTSCERAKEELGLTRHTPDEFMVTKRAPLEIPADMKGLPAPQPGAQRPQETPAKQQARLAVTGDAEAVRAAEPSSAEQSLLSKAGAYKTDKNIRALVNKEAKKGEDDKRPVIKKLLNIGDKTPPATVVDPVKEAERLQQNKKEGKPVTAGETPTVQQ